MLVRVDRKGRIVIPARIRRELGIGKVVRVKVKGGEVILEPLVDPLGSLERIVIQGTRDVEREIRRLRKAAEREALKGVGGSGSR